MTYLDRTFCSASHMCDDMKCYRYIDTSKLPPDTYLSMAGFPGCSKYQRLIEMYEKWEIDAVED